MAESQAGHFCYFISPPVNGDPVNGDPGDGFDPHSIAQNNRASVAVIH